ncbi:MAG: DUF4127 family protein [Halanaerobiaceae bacterium]
MQAKIMYIPLDERPCNYQYPQKILDISDQRAVLPPLSLLGQKKIPADIGGLQEWMKENIAGVTHLVIAIDMFLYGGIVPSRLHGITYNRLQQRLKILGKLKSENPQLKIYAYNLIMRAPAYDSSDEEPDYYSKYGRKIFKYGVLKDKEEQNIITGEEKEELTGVKKAIPDKYLDDYLQRREKNHRINLKVVEMVKEEIIDFLVIPMDDNSEYSFSARERRKIMGLVHKEGLVDRVYSYPGADEVGSVLVARAFADIKSYRPRVFVRYASEQGKGLIPRLEDRPLSESVKYHIIATGGVVVDNSQRADYVLMVNSPSKVTLEAADGWRSLLDRPELNDSERNLPAFVEAIKYYMGAGIACAVADVAMVNGSDPVLMKLLRNSNLLDKLLAYAGWNTSSNTIGTVVAHALVASYFKKNSQLRGERVKSSKKFLYWRYLEDWGYQHQIRTEVTDKLDTYEVDYFDLGDKSDHISRLIKKKLNKFSENNLPGCSYDFEVYMPWNRMFEVGIKMSNKQ